MMISVSLRIAIVFVGILAAANAAGYEGYKIFAVTPETVEQCEVLRNLSQLDDLYDFFTLSRAPQHEARVMVQPNEQKKFVELLEQHQISYRVINENVAVTVRQEFETNRFLHDFLPYKKNSRLSTDRYYTHDEINEYLEDLAERYPMRVYVKTFGISYEGRKLKTITITNGDGRQDKKVILMDGGFHAREWISPAAVIYAIEQLVENFNENAELLLDYDWVVLPVVNADGYEYSQLSSDTRFWRKTRQPTINATGGVCYGTDPNRNFDFHWNEEGASSDPCSSIYAGPKAFSEPEAIVIRDIMHTYVAHGIMYLTVHSFGNYILYPWGWTSELPDTWEDLHEVAQAGGDAIHAATGTNYTVGSSTNVLYIAAGASDDYAFNAGFPISFTMELPAGGDNFFDPPVTSIGSYVKETWVGIRAMAEELIEKYPLNAI